MQSLQAAILDVLTEDDPMTLRQLFYQLVGRGDIDKTEQQYGAVGRQCAEMRVDGRIPWACIADNTRWTHVPNTYTGIDDALEEISSSYRRDLWAESPVYVEVWLEKDALTGVLYPITSRYAVPLMVSRGFASLSYIYEAAEAIRAQEKPAYLYYIGDHDPSGLQIDISIEQRLRQFAPDAEIHFNRIAVTPCQIQQWELPTRPTKQTDSRARTFKGESVEADAIPAPMLKALLKTYIELHIDQAQCEKMRVVEPAERKTLSELAASFAP
jgi:hypothetical protein